MLIWLWNWERVVRFVLGKAAAIIARELGCPMSAVTAQVDLEDELLRPIFHVDTKTVPIAKLESVAAIIESVWNAGLRSELARLMASTGDKR